MEIKIKVQGELLAPEELEDFQGSLKKRLPEAKEKLKRVILSEGIKFAVHYWQDPSDNKKKIIDGHQRLFVLRELLSEGHTLAGVPSVMVYADSFEEAKRAVLTGASVYGVVDRAEVPEFLAGANLGVEALVDMLELPGVDTIVEIPPPPNTMEDTAQERATDQRQEYKGSAIRQVVLYYGPEDYDNVQDLIKAALEKTQVDNTSDLFKLLLEQTIDGHAFS